LKQAVAKYGPCTVSIDVEDGFMNYKGGVYDGKVNGALECDPSRINQ